MTRRLKGVFCAMPTTCGNLEIGHHQHLTPEELSTIINVQITIEQIAKVIILSSLEQWRHKGSRPYCAHKKYFGIQIIYNAGRYDSAESITLLDGLVNFTLLELKSAQRKVLRDL